MFKKKKKENIDLHRARYQRGSGHGSKLLTQNEFWFLYLIIVKTWEKLSEFLQLWFLIYKIRELLCASVFVEIKWDKEHKVLRRVSSIENFKTNVFTAIFYIIFS